MNRQMTIVAIGLGILAGGGLFRGTTAVENRAVNGVFAGLKAGQPVVLKDLGTVYEVGTMGGEKTGFEVVEVGDGYLVVVKSGACYEIARSTTPKRSNPRPGEKEHVVQREETGGPGLTPCDAPVLAA
jgi:hypothetical protein